MAAMADWIREATRRRRERWLEEGRKQGREEGRRQGREEALKEIYGPDYPDSQAGNRRQSPDADDANGGNGNDSSR